MKSRNVVTKAESTAKDRGSKDIADKNGVTECRELPSEFVTDAAATAGNQNRIAREIHN